jgi:hypothetical protein
MYVPSYSVRRVRTAALRVLAEIGKSPGRGQYGVTRTLEIDLPKRTFVHIGWTIHQKHVYAFVECAISTTRNIRQVAGIIPLGVATNNRVRVGHVDQGDRAAILARGLQFWQGTVAPAITSILEPTFVIGHVLGGGGGGRRRSRRRRRRRVGRYYILELTTGGP